MISSFPTLDISLQVLGIALLLWLGQKFIDNLASYAIDKRVFKPLWDKLRRRYKIYKTNADPIRATFSLSYTPERDLTIVKAIDRLENATEQFEPASNGKISIDDAYWNASDRKGKVELHYSDQTEKFTIDFNIVRDTESVREHPSGGPSQVLVGSIGMEVNFKFAFKHLEDTLFNLSSLISILEDCFQEQILGSFSGGRFIITPVQTNLTIDDWVEEEQFDISLLLASEDDGQAEVEFFSDRAVVRSHQREIDANTVKYMRELLLNYYL